VLQGIGALRPPAPEEVEANVGRLHQHGAPVVAVREAAHQALAFHAGNQLRHPWLGDALGVR
jgi:hypothetical protein